LKKRDDWQCELHKFLTRAKKIPFEWGKWDCCIFADEAMQSIYGERVIPDDLKWDDEKTARKAILRYGHGCLGRAVGRAAKAAGMTEVVMCAPQKGDLVLHYVEGALAVGIYDGYAIASPSDNGVARSNVKMIAKAYRA